MYFYFYVYVFLLYFMYLRRASWHSSATLTEVFPCFFFSYKANARVKSRKNGARPALFQNFCVVLCIVCFVSFCVLFVCKHVARMGEESGLYRVLVGKSEGKNHWGDLGVDGWIILEWISRMWVVGIWTGLSWPGIGVSLGPFACRDRGFESHWGHGCLSVVSVVCVVR